MTRADVTDWLNSDQSFQQGLELLSELQPSHPKIFLFRKFGYSPAHKKWLIEALEDLRTEEVKQPQKVTEKKLKPLASTPSRWFDSKKLSPTLSDEYQNRIRPLYSTRQAVHAMFDPDKDQSHNAQVSERLKEIEDQLDIFFDRARKYIEHGIEEEFGLFARYKAYERAIDTHHQYISRNRKDPRKKNKVALREIELAEDLAHFQQLESRLHELT